MKCNSWMWQTCKEIQSTHTRSETYRHHSIKITLSLTLSLWCQLQSTHPLIYVQSLSKWQHWSITSLNKLFIMVIWTCFMNFKQNKIFLNKLLITLILHSILCSVTSNYWQNLNNFHYSNKSEILTRMHYVIGIIIIFSSLFKVTQIFIVWPHHHKG